MRRRGLASGSRGTSHRLAVTGSDLHKSSLEESQSTCPSLSGTSSKNSEKLISKTSRDPRGGKRDRLPPSEVLSQHYVVVESSLARGDLSTSKVLQLIPDLIGSQLDLHRPGGCNDGGVGSGTGRTPRLDDGLSVRRVHFGSKLFVHFITRWKRKKGSDPEQPNDTNNATDARADHIERSTCVGHFLDVCYPKTTTVVLPLLPLLPQNYHESSHRGVGRRHGNPHDRAGGGA
jgi:hypothetical protein